MTPASVERLPRFWLPFGAVRRRLVPFAPPSRGTVATLVGLTIASGLAEAGALVLLARTALAITADDGSVSLLGDIDLSIGSALLVALLAITCKLAASVLSSWLSARLAARTVRHGRQVLLASFFRASWTVQSKERLGELQEYLTTAVSQLNNVNMSFVAGMNSLLSFGVIIATAVVVNPVAAVGCAVAVAILLLLLRPLTRRTRNANRRQEAALRNLGTKVTDAVRLAQEVRVFGVRRAVLDELDHAEAGASRPLQQATFTSALGPGVYQALAFTFLILGVALVSIVDGAEVASLGAAVILLLRGLSYGQSLQTSIQSLAGTLPFLDSLHERKRIYDLHAEVPGHRHLDSIGRVELRDVSFAYREGETVLDNLEFDVRPFESIGVVGPSGAGKSTLVQLLLRLREPSSGVICVDGVDLWEISDEAWAARVAFVPQDARLLSGSVAENISFFRELDPEAVERAARLAHIHDEIVSWPGGYDMSVGESGSGISGGQRQRIAIARAIAGHPDLLILDEPTSALDLPSEARLQQTLEGLKGRVGLVIVAHRLSTVKRCDRILVLKQGRAEAFDTHERLVETSAFYREAVELSMIDEQRHPSPAP